MERHYRPIVPFAENTQMDTSRLWKFSCNLKGAYSKWIVEIVLSEFLSVSFFSFYMWLKDIRTHCYCASLVCTLFIRHAYATSFSSTSTESKTEQNIELMTFALTWCANIFVGCLVTPTFFGLSLPFLILSIILKNK